MTDGSLQPVRVVREQEVPGTRVVLDDLQHSATLVGHEIVLCQRSAQQGNGLAYLRKSALAETLFVQRVAAHEMILQGSRSPDAELRPLTRFHAVADGNDYIQAVKRNWAVRRSNVHF